MCTDHLALAASAQVRHHSLAFLRTASADASVLESTQSGQARRGVLDHRTCRAQDRRIMPRLSAQRPETLFSPKRGNGPAMHVVFGSTGPAGPSGRWAAGAVPGMELVRHGPDCGSERPRAAVVIRVSQAAARAVEYLTA